MEYSITETNTTDVIFGKDDPRNFKHVHHSTWTCGSSLEESRMEAMRTALHRMEWLIRERPTTCAFVWRSETQLDLQVAWHNDSPVTYGTFVIQAKPS